ncbi:restriction endonuclease subunit S [Microbulbifer sp. 2201CG32-9]|uniref:restriction endonuclease subunit S n=1 Tax=Microbulbifer sp. 2201CG32-9 TaxID=3232309 RepID=UPI00345C1130
MAMKSVAKLPKYDSYKKCKLEWVKNIPKSWEIKPIKHLVSIRNGLDYKSVVVDEGYPVYGSGGKFACAKKFLFDGEAILLGRKGTIDKPLHVNGKFWTVDTMFYAVPKTKVNGRFFYYCCTGIPFSFYLTSTALPSMTQADLNNHQFAWPSEEQQGLISSFLDKKTKQIDEAIAIKEQQIALLKERKQIIIQKAVTQGLDPNAPMKDSGVDWIGQIPAHWEMKRVKNIFRLVMEPSEKNNDHELLSVYTDIGVKPRSELEERGNKASTTDGYWFVKKGDVVVNKLLAWMGAIGLSEYDGVTSPAYDILRPQLPVNGYFYHYLFRSNFCSAELKRHSRGIMDMRLRLYFDRFGVVEVPYPPVDEQNEIIHSLKIQMYEMDKGIDHLNIQIEKLKEYKTTLINSAVTGKIKVTPEMAGVVKKAQSTVEA